MCCCIATWFSHSITADRIVAAMLAPMNTRPVADQAFLVFYADEVYNLAISVLIELLPEQVNMHVLARLSPCTIDLRVAHDVMYSRV